MDILMRRRQNNPILTGEAGVGKTAVVEGFAQRIAAGDVPPTLRDVSLRSLDLGLLQAGASMKGEFENRLRQVIEEVKSSPKPIILFIDEAHTLIGAGGAARGGQEPPCWRASMSEGSGRGGVGPWTRPSLPTDRRVRASPPSSPTAKKSRHAVHITDFVTIWVFSYRISYSSVRTKNRKTRNISAPATISIKRRWQKLETL